MDKSEQSYKVQILVRIIYTGVAQQEEHLTFNQGVGSPNLPARTNQETSILIEFFGLVTL